MLHPLQQHIQHLRVVPPRTRATALIVILLSLPTVLLAQDTVRIELPEAISLAGGRNIDLLRAQNALRSAGTRIESARGAFQPSLTLSAGPSFRYQFGTSAADPTTVDHTSGSLSVSASSAYTIYNGGADRAAVAQAEGLARASDIAIDRTIQRTVYAVISAYYSIATQRELIEVERQNLEAERRHLERVRAFTEAGTRPISDLYTEEATLASFELRLLNAQYQFEGEKLNLVALLRINPVGRYDFPSPPPPTGVDSLSGTDAELVAQGMASRREVQVVRERLEAARQGRRVAEAGSSPTLGLTGSIGSSASSTNDRDPFAQQLVSVNPSASLGLSLQLPVLDRNRTDVAVAQAQIDYDNELLTMAEVHQQIALEVRQARINIATAQAQLQTAMRQLDASRQALEVEQTRYESGVSTLVELTQARARYVSSQGDVVQARNGLELSRHGLLYAVGITQMERVAPQPPTETGE